jgi:hypothetical protein
MGMQMSEFSLKVIEVVEKEDGSSLVVFELDDKTRNFIKNLYNWKRWSSKKFEKVLLQAIDNYIKVKEKKDV